jgi:hypothetical protein
MRKIEKAVLIATSLLAVFACVAAGGTDIRNHDGTCKGGDDREASTVPTARAWAVSWTHPNGDFWLFGGTGFDMSGNQGLLNDLWKWDGDVWTRVSGSDQANHAGVYGTKGERDPANIPGSRGQSSMWIDASGNLWLFGGKGYDAYGNVGGLCDLWKWDGRCWTWVHGSNAIDQEAIYGSIGRPYSANIPCPRNGAVSWTDKSGNLCLFGGTVYKLDGSAIWLNDQWEWDGTNWTWVRGSNLVNQPGFYGTMGMPHPKNIPGARCFAVSWTDSDGNFWLFGGEGCGEEPNGVGFLNDIWKWDGDNWTWVSGSSCSWEMGWPGSKGVPDPENTLASRGGAVGWTDDSGNLWLFGGMGVYVALGDQIRGGFLNDLWRWDGESWTWINGVADFLHEDMAALDGVYGTIGIPDAANVPCCRGNAVSWVDASGNLWLFGGQTSGTGRSRQGFLDDFWRWDGAEWTWISGSDTARGENAQRLQ